MAQLDSRSMLSGRGATGSLPQVQEGAPLEDKSAPEYRETFQQAQVEIGTLQRLAIKTRPDIAAITSILASMMTRTPTMVLKHVIGVWRYLAATWNVAMQYPRGDRVEGSRLISKEYRVTCMSDASFFPGGDRSRSGVCIFLAGK